MRIIFLLLALVGFSNHNAFSISNATLDSVGIEKKNGNSYILHEVEAGETLYALSRKYGASVQEIKDANGSGVNSLNVGQKVLIPYNPDLFSQGNTVHVVKSSETLFSISRKYGVMVDDLKKWNNISGNSISIGQKLVVKNESATKTTTASAVVSPSAKVHVVTESQTLYSISREYNVTTDQLKAWNSLTSTDLRIGQELIVSAGVADVSQAVAENSSMLPAAENKTKKSETVNQQKATQKEPPAKEVAVVAAPATSNISSASSEDDQEIDITTEKIVQKGLCQVNEDSGDTKKYLALHREAPVGTIMQVKNEMNGQSVFVRVVGTIPTTGDNSKVILKISKKAFDRLGAVDSRFPVELSYIP